jgi:hypothetical protein
MLQIETRTLEANTRATANLLFAAATYRKSVPRPDPRITTHPRFRMKMAQNV